MKLIIKISLISAVIFLGLGAGLTTLAQGTTTAEEEIKLDEKVEAEDLGIKKPKILPDSSFYFLKNWGRSIQNFFTFNPVRKAELKLKFANEKLIETKELVEKKKNSELIKEGIKNYQEEIEKIKEEVDKIKEKAVENPKVEKFLDKFINQQILHEKVLQKLEEQVPKNVFENIKEAREKHLEKFGEVMTKLEDRPEEIKEKLEKNLEAIGGSEYKDFKNLEILKNLEEKVPEKAKEAIQKAQETTLIRLKEDLEKMSSDDQEKFKGYVEEISGNKEKQLEILETLKFEVEKKPELKEKIIEVREKILEKIKTEEETSSEILPTEISPPEITCRLISLPSPDFCKEGRIIPIRDEKNCLVTFKCLIPEEIKERCIYNGKEYSLGEGFPAADGCNTCYCQKDGQVSCTKAFCQEIPSDKILKLEKTCTALWSPVCGKDNKTYSNTCFAKLAGEEVDYKGVCKTEKSTCSLECENYHYSTCPEDCVKRCVPSICSSGGLCTTDCEGAGSCQCP